MNGLKDILVIVLLIVSHSYCNSQEEIDSLSFLSPSYQELVYKNETSKLLAQLEELESDYERIRVYRSLSIGYINSGIMDSALYYGNKGMDLSLELEANEGLSHHLHTLFFVHSRRGDYEKALNLVRKYYQYLGNIGYSYGLDWLEEMLFLCFNEQNQFDSAKYYLELIESKAITDRLKAYYQFSLGQYYQRQYAYNAALYHYQQADSLCRISNSDDLSSASGDIRCIMNQSNMGFILSEIGDYENAVGYFKNAKEQFEIRNAVFPKYVSNLNWAAAAFQNNDISLASELLNQVEPFFRKD